MLVSHENLLLFVYDSDTMVNIESSDTCDDVEMKEEHLDHDEYYSSHEKLPAIDGNHVQTLPAIDGNHVQTQSSSSVEFASRLILASMILIVIYFVFLEIGIKPDELGQFRNITILWISSLISGHIGKRIFKIPPLLAIIINGIVVINLTKSVSVHESYRSLFTSMGLAIILLRSGLEMNLSSVKKSSFVCLRLTCLPGIAEATIIGFLSKILFGMNIWFGLTCGFIVAAVSPAIVTVEMMSLKSQGYGIDQGIPSLIIAAASLDDIVAIMGFSIFIGLAVKSEATSFMHALLHGIYSVGLGVIFGFVASLITAFQNVWNCNWKRVSILFLTSLAIMSVMKVNSYPSAGAIGSLSLGIASRLYWNVGLFKKQEVTDFQYIKEIEKGVAVLWSLIFEPLLFGSIGFSLQLNVISYDVLLKSFALVIVGVFCRLAVAYIVTHGTTFTMKERLFIAVAWLPKATVQAALCFIPLNLVSQSIPTDHKFYGDYMTWSKNISSIAMISICITAPLGLLSINYFGKRWLSKSQGDAIPTSTSNKV